jgi:DnaJ-class molecular chaperone
MDGEQDQPRVLYSIVCGTCGGTGQVRHRRAVIGRPAGGPPRVVGFAEECPVPEVCADCNGQGRTPVYEAS